MAGWISAIGEVGHFIADAGRSLRDVKVWPSLTVEQMKLVGVDSVPIALFIASFTGVVLSMQASYTLTGAVPLCSGIATVPEGENRQQTTDNRQ